MTRGMRVTPGTNDTGEGVRVTKDGEDAGEEGKGPEVSTVALGFSSGALAHPGAPRDVIHVTCVVAVLPSCFYVYF